jgi:hypothetical protein
MIRAEKRGKEFDLRNRNQRRIKYQLYGRKLKSNFPLLACVTWQKVARVESYANPQF